MLGHKQGLIGEDESVVQQICKDFHQTLLLHDLGTSSCDDVNMAENVNASGMLDLSGQTGNSFKCLTKSATFPLIDEVRSQSSHAKKKPGLLSKMFDDPSSVTSESPAYERSTSLPGSLNLISAMKGGREQSGIASKMVLRMKWASDVYDPPSSSLSHTVKDHLKLYQLSSKGKKDHRRGKHKGGKSSYKAVNGNNKRKNSSCTSFVAGRVIEDLIVCPKLQEADDQVLPDGSTIDVFSASIGDHEAKCGSRALEESLRKIHDLPIAS